MALTRDERSRVRRHLGYPNISDAASLAFGVPTPIETLFIVEKAMDNLLPEGEDRCRRLVNVLDNIDQKLICAQDRLKATRIEELYLRDGEPDLLEREYARWAGRLADELAVPIYAYSWRFKQFTGGCNVPVRGR